MEIIVFIDKVTVAGIESYISYDSLSVIPSIHTYNMEFIEVIEDLGTYDEIMLNEDNKKIIDKILKSDLRINNSLMFVRLIEKIKIKNTTLMLKSFIERDFREIQNDYDGYMFKKNNLKNNMFNIFKDIFIKGGIKVDPTEE